MSKLPGGKPATKRVILVVDDEPAVLNFVQRALIMGGYLVLAASSATEALNLARGFDGAIDLLLSDVDMPEMRGPQLAIVMRREMPATRILLMSGRSAGPVPADLKANLLRKPFGLSALIGQIEAALAGEPARLPE